MKKLALAEVLEGIEDTRRENSVEKGHGRIESRTCVISEEIGWLNGKEDWSGISGIGVIYCEAEENGQKSKQSHYFIFSLFLSSKIITLFCQSV